MPYVVVIAGFAIFLALGALSTASSFAFSALRWLRPYTWRVWLWGSIGFVAGNAFLFALLYRELSRVAVSGMEAQHGNVVDVLVGVAVDFGPLLVSTVGIVGGSVLGFYLARRCARGTLPGNEKASP